MSLSASYPIYLRKLQSALRAHDMSVDAQTITFSNSALAAAVVGNWKLAIGEFRSICQRMLDGKLSNQHVFLSEPYVRRINLPNQGEIAIAIVNSQSRDWYGTEQAIGSFDFLHEAQRGIFDGCKRFLDLGGHQFVWTCFYAMRSSESEVVVYEPSILNVTIGLFNCLLNDVIDRVDVVPFAALASNALSSNTDNDKMLVDFMTVPIRTKCINYPQNPFDFIKTDIEGYEFEMLNDPFYLDSLRHAKCCHLELHLGHLAGRGVHLQDWLNRLQAANLRGTELYSQVEMFQFLKSCDPKGFYSFLVTG